MITAIIIISIILTILIPINIFLLLNIFTLNDLVSNSLSYTYLIDSKLDKHINETKNKDNKLFENN